MGKATGGLWKVDCEGFMAFIAHTALKAVFLLGHCTGPPGPDGPNEYPHHREAASSGKPVSAIPCPNPAGY